MQLDQKYFQSRFSADEIAATQRLCGDFLKRNRIDLDEIDFHGSDWNTLCGASREAGRELSRIIELRHGDKPDPAATLALEVLQEVRQEIEDAKTTQRGSGKSHLRPYADGVARHDGYEAEEASIALKPEERFADWSARNGASSGSEFRGLTTGAMIRAVAFGAKTEQERRALSEGTDSAGGFSVPTILSAQIIDRLRAQSVLIRAGARTVPLSSDQNVIAKLTADPTPAWRAESAAIAVSDPTFGAVSLAPKSLAVLVKFSRELLADSVNLEAALLAAVTGAMALELDRAGLFGTGADNQPRGVVNVSGINAVALNAKLTAHAGGAYGPLVAARTALLTANAGEPTGFVMSPREDGVLTGLRDGNGQPVMAPPKIAAVQALVTTSVATNLGVGTNESTIVAGNFAHLLIGMRETMRLSVLRERYAETGELALVCHLRADIAVEHPLAFCAVTGIKPEA
ncbi:COG4653 Predicted phage phi-C31 gp36 major capsid-like protein [Caulobacteraceae bacterium]